VKGTDGKFKNLVLVGEYMHSVGRYMVAKVLTRHVPRIGAPVFDKYGRKLGVVTDVFGPVGSPYITIKGNRSQRFYVRESDLLGQVGR